MTYEHPWYSEQRRLENTTNLDSQSKQKPKPETTGRKSTKDTPCKYCGRPVEILNNIKGKTYYRRECSRCNVLKKKYGITSVEADWMYFVQEGKCANSGCNNEAECVDHCHTSGNVRQMLCKSCNSAYGFLGEDPQRIAGLLQYLSTHV